MEKRIAVAAIICAGLIVSASIVAYSNLYVQRSVSVTVILKSVTIGIYRDLECSSPVVSIEWGIVEPGTRTERIIYIRNEANVNLMLSLETATWNPPDASRFIGFGWNYTGFPLLPMQVIPSLLRLDVYVNVTGITAFSFTIIFEGVG